MPQLKHVQSALGWSLVGLLLTVVLLNAIGFVSPFWGLWRSPGDVDASRDLLRAWHPITPWFSILFAVAGWHLAMTMDNRVARVAVMALGVLIPVAHIGARLLGGTVEQAGSGPMPLSAAIALFGDGVASLAGLVLLALAWRAVRLCNQALGPAIGPGQGRA